MKYAAFIDLNAFNFDFNMYQNALKKIDGDIIYTKFYSFSQKKHNDFLDYIKENNVDVAIPLHNKKRVRIDIRQVVDVIQFVSSKKIDGIFLVCAEIDASYLINAIKTLNVKVVLGILTINSLSDYVDDYIILDRININDLKIPYTDIVCCNKEVELVKYNIDCMIKNDLNNQDKRIESSIEIEELLRRYFN